LASLLRGGVLGISVLGKGLGLLEISIVISNLLLGISILLVSVGSLETLSTITCSRGILVAFIVSEVVYYRS